MTAVDPFAPARAIADAVLYEGYVLYPYRASADKNRIRWQWGVVGPAGAHADGVGEAPAMAADLVVETSTTASVRLRLRFLQVVSRTIERLDTTGPVTIGSVTIGEETHISFDDAEERMVEAAVAVGAGRGETVTRFHFDEDEAIVALGQADGSPHRLVRRRRHLSGELLVRAERVDAGSHLIHATVRNTTPWEGGDRDDASHRSFVGAHILGFVDGGAFVSTLDPPAEHLAAVDRCEPDRLWPVLVGGERRAPMVLGSPVILYDQPEIAPESQGSFYDGLEIDELLSLRVMTMTDAEKAEARATDPRSAAIVDRVESMSDDDLARLHGAVRDPDPPQTRSGRSSVAPDGAMTDQNGGGGDAFDVPTIVGDGAGNSRGGTRVSTPGSIPTPMVWWWVASRSPGAAWSGSIPADGPMPTTCSTGTAPPRSPPSSTTSTAASTWP